jgi:hypothetical protein
MIGHGVVSFTSGTGVSRKVDLETDVLDKRPLSDNEGFQVV